MLVEIFEVTEQTATERESESNPEALRLIESLGLKGQEKFLKQNEQGVVTRCPYRLMTLTEHRVYSVLMPSRHGIDAYDGQIIPVRVLQVAAHAKETGMFKRLEIWHAEGKDDPLLIGSTSSYEWSRHGQRESYLLARWGNELKAMEELIGEATKIVSIKFKMFVQEAMNILGPISDNPTLQAELFIRTGKKPSSVVCDIE